MNQLLDLRNSVIEANLTWFQEEFSAGIRIKIGINGQIAAIGRDISAENVVKFPSCAIVPGLISSHSHAFHRNLRGKSCIGDQKASSFWGWRDEMYKSVEKMDRESFYKICFDAFREMRNSGITTVGEFHYFHHESSEVGGYEFDKIILKAAKEAGIRIVLLLTLYEQADVKGAAQLLPSQERFKSESLEQFWTNFDHVKQNLCSTQSLGVAAHSVRAVSVPNLKSLRKESEERKIPFHIHLEEQMKEIGDFFVAYGQSPACFVLKNLNPNESLTAVHCTFTEEDTLSNLMNTGANISICPLTEGYLGDGVPNLPTETKQNYISFGTDCNNRICLTEEARWFTYLQQTKLHHRGIDLFGSKNHSSTLFDCLTTNGARSLGLSDKCGRLETGFEADFCLIDLAHQSLDMCTADSLMDAFIFGCSTDAVIEGNCVAGLLEHKGVKIEIMEAKADQTKAGDGPNFQNLKENHSVGDLLFAMMEFDSTTGKEGPISTALGDYLKSRGWLVKLQPVENENRPPRFNIYATRQAYPAGHGGPKLILNSHTDTVPPYIEPSWAEGGAVIKGRGSCDAKGQMAAMIFAAEKLVKEKPAMALDLGLLFVVEEETSHIGMKTANELALRPKFMIVGEPTELRFASRQKGALKITLSTAGKAAHSGYPERGSSAVEKMLDILEDLRKTQWPGDDKLGHTTMNIGILQGGQAMNALAAHAEAHIFFRVTTDARELLQQVAAIVADRGTIEIKGYNDPVQLQTMEGHPTAVVAFNTDLPYFELGEGIPYLYGPGSIQDAHSAWEFIRIADLETAVGVYCETIVKLLGGVKG